MVSVVITSTPIRKSALAGNARSNELHNFILHIAVGKNLADDGKRNILRSYTRTWSTFQINSNYAWHINIVCLAEAVLQAPSALSHSHGSKCSVSCMTVRAEDHLSAACKHFSCKLMDNCLMRRYINSAVLWHR